MTSFRYSSVIAFAASTLVLSSCAFVRSTENEPLDPRIIRQFVAGQTKAHEVTKRLGAPSQIVELGDRSAYRFDHTVTKGAGLFLPPFLLGGSDSRSDRLWVFFDQHGVLTHLGSTFQSHRAQYALPWDNVHEESDSRSADAGRPELEQR